MEIGYREEHHPYGEHGSGVDPPPLKLLPRNFVLVYNYMYIDRVELCQYVNKRWHTTHLV